MHSTCSSSLFGTRNFAQLLAIAGLCRAAHAKGLLRAMRLGEASRTDSRNRADIRKGCAVRSPFPYLQRQEGARNNSLLDSTPQQTCDCTRTGCQPFSISPTTGRCKKQQPFRVHAATNLRLHPHWVSALFHISNTLTHRLRCTQPHLGG